MNTKTFYKGHYLPVSIYVDDLRTPARPGWLTVRSYYEFIDTVQEVGLDNVELISLDHDLGDVGSNSSRELTGYDCAKWLVEQWMDGKKVCKVLIHSANPVGSSNIQTLINNYKASCGLVKDCEKVVIQNLADIGPLEL